MRLYNLTCDGYSFISTGKPTAVPESHYSLIEIYYDHTKIGPIKGIYVGNNVQSEHIFSEMDINDILIGTEQTYQEKILSYISTLSEEDKNDIINNTEIIDFCNEKKDQILYILFMIGLGSVLFYYHLMTLDQKKIGSPFDPINITFPFNRVDTIVLDQNLYSHIKYAGDILMVTNTRNIGKLWMKQIMDFWNVWGLLFPQKLSFNNNKIMYESVLGYGKYLQEERSNLTKCYNTAQKVISKECDRLKTNSMEINKAMMEASDNFKKKFRYASLLITVITSIVLKTIGTETKISLKEYKDTSATIMKEQLDLLRDSAPKISEKIRSDIGKTINKNISRKINKSVSDNIKIMEDQIDEIRGEMTYLKELLSDNGDDNDNNNNE